MTEHTDRVAKARSVRSRLAQERRADYLRERGWTCTPPTDPTADLAVSVTRLAMSALVGINPLYDDQRYRQLPTAIRDVITVKAAIAFLIEQALIAENAAARDGYLPIGVPTVIEDDIVNASMISRDRRKQAG